MDFITKNLNLFTKNFNNYFTKCFIKWVLRVLVGIIFFYNNTLLAIGLSEIKVNSYLNEPLNASIKITGAEELDPLSLVAGLANAKDFMRAGIPRPFLLSHLKFETKNFNQDLIVHISSNIVIKDPFFDFLLQLTWPEGTMIKSYNILLDPKPVEQKNINTNLNKQLVADPKAVVDPATNGNNTDAIFASSLEQPNENELLIDNKLNLKSNKLDPKKNPKIKNLENFTNIEPNTNHIENLNYINDNNKDNTNPHSLLTKLINNLQNFSENSKKNKINYQKLLELTPESISLSKDEEKLAENFAISQVNSELNALRGEKSKKLNSNINNNIEQLKSDQDNLNSEQTSNNSNSKHYHAYYTDTRNVELFSAKYGNNLLLAFFLVSATMYLFYKLISATQVNIGIMEVDGNNLQQNEQPNINLKASSTTRKSANQFVKSIATNMSKDDFNNIEIEHNNLENSNIGFLRDEELELKMGLANQYIAAGDKKSARELLQEIINVKDQKYKVQITNMLKAVN